MPLVKAKCINCGANLNVDGAKDTIICEFCGSSFFIEKSTNDLTNSNDNELNQLLKSAISYKTLNDTEKGLLLCDQVISKYPYNVKAYLLKFDFLLNKVNKYYTKKDLENISTGINVFASYFGEDFSSKTQNVNYGLYSYPSISDFIDIQSKVYKLSPDFDEKYFDKKWEKLYYTNTNNCHNAIDNIKAGKLKLFSDILTNSYIPEGFIPYIESCKKDAISLKKLCSPAHLKGLLSLKKQYRNKDVDGYVIPEDVDDILLVTPTELLVHATGVWKHPTIKHYSFIVLLDIQSNNFNKKKPIDVINACCLIEKENENLKTYEEKILFLLNNSNDQLSELQNIYDMFSEEKNIEWVKSPYQLKDLSGYSEHIFIKDFNVICEHQSIIIKFRYFVTPIERLKNDDTFYNSYYILTIPKEKTSAFISYIEQSVSNKRINNNNCRYCGGEFKGIFNNVCSKCGKPKDY